MQHIFTVTRKNPALCYVSQGVPLPKGLFSANTGLELVDDKGVTIPCHSKVLSLWPDRSIRWVLIDCVLPKCHGNTKMPVESKYFVQTSAYKKLSIKPKWVNDNKNDICLTLPSGELILSKLEFLSLARSGSLSSLDTQWQLCDYLNQLNEAQAGSADISYQLDNISTQHEVTYCQAQQPLYCQITQSASYVLSNGLRLNANANIRVYFASSHVQIQLKMHNPQAIVHNGGKWDLGNPHSIFFKALKFDCSFTDITQAKYSAPCALSPERENNTDPFFDLLIEQHSSGGEFFNSNTHKSADNQVHIQHKGATLSVDEQSPITVLRPSPVLEYSNEAESCVIVPQGFWQRFPSALCADTRRMQLDYSGVNSSEQTNPLELQPGEILSQRLHIHFRSGNDSGDSLLKPDVVIAPTLIAQSHAIPMFSSAMHNDELQRFIDQGISGASNFFNKREQLDEYGWRNFGDIYADHEASESESGLPFVSHYNNQYDPLQGFIKQWLLSGDPRWRELADDLFEHVVNIDIYHTEYDKPEYNQGLFWHTDHYLEAQTATHRTYSKHQQADVYMDHAGGGGPGAHHCYTSGLALYYCISGKQEAFECLSGMVSWMQHIYEGDQTLLGLFLRLKNANFTLPFTQKPILGHGTGVVRDPVSNRYPLDRGTGNYVNALLDGFDIQQDLALLSEVERVILNTISEDDDISERGFDDIENTWFYIVFLQAVAKYLLMAKSLSEPRGPYGNILQAYLHYARYVEQHESPYLTHANKLEYPNDTWTAQDLRKVHVLACAALLTRAANDTNEESQRFSAKAKSLQQWIDNKLSESDESALTRILALLMQNYGALSLLNGSPHTQNNQTGHNQCASHNMSSSIPSRILNFLKHYSISQERRNLVQRIPKLQKWLGKP